MLERIASLQIVRLRGAECTAPPPMGFHSRTLITRSLLLSTPQSVEIVSRTFSTPFIVHLPLLPPSCLLIWYLSDNTSSNVHSCFKQIHYGKFSFSTRAHYTTSEMFFYFFIGRNGDNKRSNFLNYILFTDDRNRNN